MTQANLFRFLAPGCVKRKGYITINELEERMEARSCVTCSGWFWTDEDVKVKTYFEALELNIDDALLS